LKSVAVRGFTYGIIGTLAWGAVRYTPPITTPRAPLAESPVVSAQAAVSSPETQPVAVAPVIVTEPESNVPVLRYDPVIVNAQLLSGVDTVALTGTIHSSLIASLEHVGDGEIPRSQRRSLAWSLADIFEHRIDMSRDLDDGDKFHILVERLQQPNGKIIINRILGARLSLGDHVVEAIHFKSRNSSSQWFDGNGKSLTASFLRTPVNFRRITSVFGLREHPIFGTWRNHTGTDYAAPMGTPVRAIGDGVVVNAGWMGGYGRVIDIRHANGFVSRYGHLSGFAGHLHSGQHVKMGQTIGYVGMTGWATGPHLHFEIRVNGVARDPKLALQNRSGDPLTGSDRRLFNEIREHTLSVMRRADAGHEVALR
jgi:murein DD-endopeptidase MepM/ murein hydrolase activator NlpD